MADQREPDPQQPIMGAPVPGAPLGSAPGPVMYPGAPAPPKKGMSTGCIILLIIGVLLLVCAGGCALFGLLGYQSAKKAADEAGIDLGEAMRSGMKMAFETEPIPEVQMTYRATVTYTDTATGQVVEEKTFKGVQLGGVGVAVIGFSPRSASDLGRSEPKGGQSYYVLELACQSVDEKDHSFDTEFAPMLIKGMEVQLPHVGTTQEHQSAIPASGEMAFPELIFEVPSSATDMNLKLIHTTEKAMFATVVLPTKPIEAEPVKEAAAPTPATGGG